MLPQGPVAYELDGRGLRLILPTPRTPTARASGWRTRQSATATRPRRPRRPADGAPRCPPQRAPARSSVRHGRTARSNRHRSIRSRGARGGLAVPSPTGSETQLEYARAVRQRPGAQGAFRPRAFTPLRPPEQIARGKALYVGRDDPRRFHTAAPQAEAGTIQSLTARRLQ